MDNITEDNLEVLIQDPMETIVFTTPSNLSNEENDFIGVAEEEVEEVNRGEPDPNIFIQNVRPPRTWQAGKENLYASNPPPLLETPKVNFEADTPYDFFMKMFPETIMEQIVAETNRYAAQQETLFNITLGDIQTYLGMKIIMTYIKYPQNRMYWSSIMGLGLPVVSEAMPVVVNR